jgi:pectate lyase
MGDCGDHEFEQPEPFFEGQGLTFINCGSDLIYAGAILYRLTGDRGALAWSKRLAEQYVRARHPETGLGVYQYSKPTRSQAPPAEGPLEGRLTWSTYGDRAENQFGAEFGEVAREGYMLRSPDSIYGNNAIMQLQLAEWLRSPGDERTAADRNAAAEKLLAWTRDGLLAYARHGYEPEDNTIRPMWADGTDLTDYVIKRDGYYGKQGRVFRAQRAPAMLFWSYTLGARLTDDEELWQTARSIAKGQGLGDLGNKPGSEINVNLESGNADPLALFGLLEVIRIQDAPAYRDLARRIGDNIVRRRFHEGFFRPTPEHVNANFNAIEPLALLALEAMLRGTPDAVPPYNTGRGYIHGPHDGLGRTTDATAIWSVKRDR